MRLGIPWLIGVTLVGPIMTYIRHYSHSYNNGVSPKTYWNYWVTYMKNGIGFPVGYMPSLEQFNQHHFWFISLLLCFFILFCFLYIIKEKWVNASSRITGLDASSDRSIFGILLLVGFLTSSGFFILHRFCQDKSHMDVYWVTIGNLLQFQPTRMILYICYFALGVYAFVKKWFIIGKIPGRLSVWVITCAGLLLGLLIIVKDLAVVPSPSLGLQFMFALVRSFLCLSLLIVFTVFSLNYWNRPSQINQLLAANSYNIYLVHYVVVVVFQFLLKDFWEVPILIKFGIVSLSSIFISYGISQYMIKAFPCLSIFGIFALFVCMSIFIHPV